MEACQPVYFKKKNGTAFLEVQEEETYLMRSYWLNQSVDFPTKGLTLRLLLASMSLPACLGTGRGSFGLGMDNHFQEI
jgi:hypothetical protein